MNAQNTVSSKPTATQSAVVAALSIALSYGVYSEWFRSCCLDYIDNVFFIFVLFPASLVQLALAGFNVHGGGTVPELRFAIGLTIEFYLLLWSFRWIRNRFNNADS